MLQLSADEVKRTYQNGLKKMKARNHLGAKRDFERVILALGQRAEPHYQLGICLLALGRPQSARASLQTASRLAPTEPTILAQLATAYARTGARDEALATHDALIRLQPNALKPKVDKAVALQQFGAFDAAEEIFRRVQKKHKTESEVYRIWFANRRLTAADRPIINDALKLWKHPRLKPVGKIHTGFALAKAFEDLGETDRVFEFLNGANQAQAAQAPYDRAAREKIVSEIETVAAQGPVARRGSSEHAPIFIVGVPRSGTTLIERCLAAHPAVRSGGEIGQGRAMAYATFGAPGHLAAVHAVENAALARYAELYWRAADETALGDAPRVADKSMQLQLVIGYLAAAFPKAHFVVVRRDPRDVALSIYRNHFALGTHRYANDFSDIAHQLQTSDRALDAWRDKVPWTEVRYEALTSDPDVQIRALIDAVDLPWDDACLDHRTSRGTVQTLSIAQVRKPIYKTAQGGWQRYETEMQPFIEAWEAYG